MTVYIRLFGTGQVELQWEHLSPVSDIEDGGYPVVEIQDSGTVRLIYFVDGKRRLIPATDSEEPTETYPLSLSSGTNTP